MRIVSTSKAIADKIGRADHPGLMRSELTPDGKRSQLWGLGIRGADADRIMSDLYGRKPDDGAYHD